MRFWQVLGAGIIVLGVIGCPPEKKEAAAGRGSATCNEWQTAFCDFAKRCNGGTASAVCAEANAVTCKADGVAADCATTLQDAACTAIPSGCAQAEVADRAAASKLCNEFVTAKCNAEARCGAPRDLCISQLATVVDCRRAIGVSLALESCLDTLASLSCGANIPAVCDNLVLESP